MNIIEQLKRDEGFRADVYIDTVGKCTVGYGHNLDANPLPVYPPITEETAEGILVEDINEISKTLYQHITWAASLDEVYQGVLINMSFNMGVIGLVGFHNMLSFLYQGRYNRAADEMRNSKWYVQVGDRAKRLCQQMETGEWV